MIFCAFSLLGLGLVALQRLFISYVLPEAMPGDLERTVREMQMMHGAFLLYLPMLILIGSVFAISGYYLRRGSSPARQIAQANAFASYIWIGAYAFTSSRLIEKSDTYSQLISLEARTVFIIAGILIMLPVPTAILYILRRTGY